jgi:hypothetical protein
MTTTPEREEFEADLRILEEALAAKPTPGPWLVHVKEIPHMYGGKHVERRIFTTWNHPQLKGPIGVVNGSVGVPAEKGEPAVHMVSIEAVDAAFIAACSPDRIRRLLAAARQSAPESCRKVDDCTESLCMQANRCKHTLPPQPQRLCVEQSEDRRDAERYRWLRKWLTENGLLRAVFCRPDIKAKTGDWWVLHKPYGIISDSCVGYAKTDDAAIDAAMRA